MSQVVFLRGVNVGGKRTFQPSVLARDLLAKRPRTLPTFPLLQPAGEQWQVRVVGVTGPFALSLWHRRAGTLVYPNEVVEKRLRVPATTRNWNTIEALAQLLV